MTESRACPLCRMPVRVDDYASQPAELQPGEFMVCAPGAPAHLECLLKVSSATITPADPDESAGGASEDPARGAAQDRQTPPRPSRKPLARATGRRLEDGPWAVVLAGGHGMRLRGLARRVCGQDRPKQYVPLLGPRTLLRQTLDRVALGVPPERTVVVTLKEHADYVAAELSRDPAPRKSVIQPLDRGTAAGVLLPALWIARRDPEATVVVFPSDHFVLEEGVFMEHVARVAAFVRRHPEWLILLGARPTHPDPDYGWIELGEIVGEPASGPVRRARHFWEKPGPDAARACLEAGCVWNTFVMVARASLLLEAGRRCLPELSARLERIAAFAGSELEAWAVRQAYALMPAGNFSRSVLEACPPFLAVSTLPPLSWSDIGTPRRVFEVLQQAQLAPPWLAQVAASG